MLEEMTYEFKGSETTLHTNDSELFFRCLREIEEREELLSHSINNTEPCSNNINNAATKTEYCLYGMKYHIRTFNKEFFFDYIGEIITKEKDAPASANPSAKYRFHGNKYDLETTNKDVFFEQVTNILDEEKSLSSENGSSLSKNRYECYINGLWFETHNPELFFLLACEAAIGFAENATDVEPDSKKWDLNCDSPWRASQSEDKEECDSWAWNDDVKWVKRYKKMNLINIEFHTGKESSDDELVVKAGFWKRDGVVEFDKDIQTPKQLEESRIFYKGGEWGTPPPTSIEDMSIDEFYRDYKNIIRGLMQGN